MSIGRRSDAKFIEHLLRKIGSQPTSAAAQNLRKIETVVWLQNQSKLIDQFDDALQYSSVQFVLATGISRAAVFKFVAHLLTHGKPGGRARPRRRWAVSTGRKRINWPSRRPTMRILKCKRRSCRNCGNEESPVPCRC